ncbi:MAG: XdhC family protein [Dehalococcoidia bacterium]|nr:XdhC family protein [Dehalococcoidia bacterium]
MNEAYQAEITEAIQRALDGGAPVAVATVTSAGAMGLAVGAKLLVRSDGEVVGGIAEAVDRILVDAALDQLRTLPRITVQTVWLGADGSAAVRRSQAAADATTVMMELYEAPARLLIVGGGHVGLAVATLGELCGMEVSVFDDREEFANRERFPMAEHVFAGDTAAALDAIDMGASDFVVLVSRGHQLDEMALRHTVGRGAAYVGMIGSRRRTQTVLEHLRDLGVPAEVLATVRTPIGLDIGAETPEEIAVAILAEIIMVRRGGTGAVMSRRT